MKKLKFLLAAGSVLAAVFALTLLGCPKEPEEDQIDSRLIGPWTNGQDGGMKKEFTIAGDASFTASINPTYVGAYNQAYAAALDGGASNDAAAQAAQEALAQLEESGATDALTRWTVTGKLVKDDGDVYIMTNLHETSGQSAAPGAPSGSADGVVNAFSAAKVEITFSTSEQFEFKSADGNDQVTAFFGGDYTKK